ncbi:MAG: ATP-grasp domain-containing protein [Rhodopirellula sp.]|nr:ATP-grasp domain-containing protein [Rhodopirellula sp.]
MSLFSGRVAYKDDFRDAIAPSRYNSTTLVVVSTPKEIGREWRLVVARDEVVAASQYRDHGAISVLRGCPEDVSQFVADVLSRVHWRPDSVFMMDVRESEDRLCVLELNSFSCSGLYHCDLAAVVRAVSEVAEEEWTARRVA